MNAMVTPETRSDRQKVDRPRRRRTWLMLPLLIVAAAAGAGIYATGMAPRWVQRAELKRTAHEIKSLIETPRVKVVRSSQGGKPLSLRLPADLYPDQESSIQPRAAGYLKRVLVDIGDRVESGQLLAEIDAPEMIRDLERIRATVVQARAEADLARARLELASLNLKRVDSLTRRSATTGQELDETRAAYQVSVATVASADATVSAREADVKRLEVLSSFLRVLSPYNGTITFRGFDPGSLVAAEGSGQKPLFRIAQDELLKVVVSVPQAHLDAVRLGQDVRILVQEFPGEKFVGHVSRTARAVDPASRTLRTEIDLPNARHTLYSGMFVEVEFAKAITAPLTVPASAIVNGPEGARVVVVGPGGKVHLQPIEIRRDLGGRIEVAGGLKGDEILVENPSSGLADGARVEVVKPNQPAPGAASPVQESLPARKPPIDQPRPSTRSGQELNPSRTS